MTKYVEDKVGLYNEEVFRQSGEKFRPFDWIDGNTVILNNQIVLYRSKRQKYIPNLPDYNPANRVDANPREPVRNPNSPWRAGKRRGNGNLGKEPAGS